MSATHIPRLGAPALGLAVLGGLAAAAAAVFMPEIALGLAVVALVVVILAGRRVQRLGRGAVVLAVGAALLGPNLAPPGLPWLFGFRILIVATILGAVGWLLMGRSIPLPRAITTPVVLLSLLVLLASISLAWAADPVAAARWTSFMVMMGTLAVAVAVVGRRPEGLRLIILALAIVFAAAVMVAVAELGLGLRLPTRDTVGDAARRFGAASFFGNPNNFATYLSLTLPFFLVAPVVWKDARRRLLAYAGTGTALLLLLFTGSKSNLLAVALILTAFILIVGRDRRARARVIGAAVVAVIAVAVVVPSVQGSGVVPLPQQAVSKFDFRILAAQVESGTGSGGTRSSLTDQGLGLVSSTRGRGVGAGNAEGRIRAGDSQIRVTNLHNWWLEVLVNLGVVGLLLFVAFWLTLLRGSLRAWSRGTRPETRWLGLAAALALIGFVVAALAPSSAIHFAPMWITFGAAMTAMVLLGREAT